MTLNCAGKGQEDYQIIGDKVVPIVIGMSSPVCLKERLNDFE